MKKLTIKNELIVQLQVGYYELSSGGGIFIWEDPYVTIYDKPEIKMFLVI